MKITSLQTQKVLSPTQITLSDYAINTYRGCEFGCLYCYSQNNKNIKKTDFFNCLGTKPDAPRILAKELKYCRPKKVLLGSTTECFQYQEKKEKITEKVLSILNDYNIPYTILTKSHLIADCLPLISENKENKIYFTLNFSCDTLIRLLENSSPSLDKRIEAIKRIISFKIKLRIHIGPFIPYISDLEKILQIVPEGVSEVGIELYHQKQGNFEGLIEAIKKNIGPDTAKNILKIYTSKDTYYGFARQLKASIRRYSHLYPFKFFYFVPEFGNFYTPCFDYEKSPF